jgi:hypothetical protein
MANNSSNLKKPNITNAEIQYPDYIPNLISVVINAGKIYIHPGYT